MEGSYQIKQNLIKIPIYKKVQNSRDYVERKIIRERNVDKNLPYLLINSFK